MTDLARDLRLAVDTGKVAIGTNEVERAINTSSAKMVVVASNGKKEAVADIAHLCNIGGIKFIKFDTGSLEFGAICGKPYSINAVAIIEPGNSNILNESY